MEPALKQRVVGAIVLVALAVIFLPMLVKGPAPESGVSDVPLELPDAPQGALAGEGVRTEELPLVSPASVPASGVVGMDASDATSEDPDTPVSSDGMMPAASAGGDYAVSFGRYATAVDAKRVVDALMASQLPGYQEEVTDKGRTLHRVRIGPYATQADAEAARLRSAHVRDDVGAKVVVLSATDATSGAAQPASGTAQAALAKPEPAETEPAKVPAKPEPKPVATAPTRPASTAPATAAPTTKPVQPVAAKPAPAKPVATPTAPAAAGTGFAVQLAAFGNAEEAGRLRDRARAAGLRAFVDSVRTDKGTLTRVRVGPVLTRAEADQLKAQAAAKLGIADAIVKPHP